MIINHKRCYKAARKEQFPDVGDQLDAIYKLAKALEGIVEMPPEVQSWISELDAVKAKFPKDPE